MFPGHFRERQLWGTRNRLANLWRILTANSSNSATLFFTSLLRPGRIANVHF